MAPLAPNGPTCLAQGNDCVLGCFSPIFPLVFRGFMGKGCFFVGHGARGPVPSFWGGSLMFSSLLLFVALYVGGAIAIGLVAVASEY